MLMLSSMKKTMESNDYLKIIISKLSDLEKKVRESDDPAADVRKLRNFFTGDKHIQQMKCLQSFITYLWENSEVENRDTFVNQLKEKARHCETENTYAFIDGSKVKFTKMYIKSISFGQCSQRDRTAFFEAVKVYATGAGINFDDWFKHWRSNENTI